MKLIVQAMLVLVFWLTLVIALIIVGSLPLYAWQALQGQWANDVHLTFSQLWHNYWQLWQYLNFPWQKSLKLTNFIMSASGRQHFAEVKQLFLINWSVLLASGLALMWPRDKQQKNNRQISYRLVLMGSLILASLAISDFDQFFILFHETLFQNNDWVFNPSTDPIILVLPESFFATCFLVAGMVWLAGLLVLSWPKKQARTL